MSRPRMRPLFRLSLPIARAQFMDTIRNALAAGESPVSGRALRSHVELTVRPSARHFWWRHLSIDGLEDGEGTLLRGRYAPHPHLWMLIMAVYGVLLLAAIGACVYGFSQWSLGWAPRALWALPLCAAAVAATWLASAVGQTLAQPQMQELHGFFEECVRRASEPPRELACRSGDLGS